MNYYVCPGNVISKNDGDFHFVSAQSLIDLYRVKPSACITDRRRLIPGLDYITLCPSNSGKYNEMPKPRRLISLGRAPFYELIWEKVDG